MPVDVEPRPRDGTPLVWEWIVNVGPPMLVLVDLQVGYMLVSRNCLEDDRLSNHLAHGFFLLAALLLLLKAWSLRRAAGAEWPGTGLDLRTRSRFMAALGILIASLSALVIAAQWIPVFMLHPCQ
jgi:hypothetical protein